MTIGATEIVSYLKTQLSTISNPKLDNVEYTDHDTAPPRVKNYGVHIYIGNDDPEETQRRHIGPLLTEIYRINLDIIINKHYRKVDGSITDTHGVGYWIKTVKELLQGGKNSGAFEDSFWEFNELDSKEDGYKIKGLFTCEILNQY